MSIIFVFINIRQQMLDKESLASIILSHNKAKGKIGLNASSMGIVSYQREKGALIRQILNFHHEKFSQKREYLHRESKKTSHLSDFIMKHETQPSVQNQENYQSNQYQPYISNSNINIYYNQYHSNNNKNVNQIQKEQQQCILGQELGVIDLFLKKEHNNHEILLRLETVSIANGTKMENKSFNQSTMAFSKLQRSQLSPYRKIRKTQNHNPPQLPQISQDNNSQSLFNLTQNEPSMSLCKQPSQKDQIKKIRIDLNQVKKATQKQETTKIPQKTNTKEKIQSKFDQSLEEVEQYDQLFDCSSGKKQDYKQQERQGVFNYLKDKFARQKFDKNQKIMSKDTSNQSLNDYGSNGSSLTSFHSMIQRQKKEVHSSGLQNINLIVGQTIKTVNQNIHMHQSKKDDNNASLMLFPNASQPSTVQKLDERSNDKSELLRHLQDLGDYSISTELFKKIEPIQTSKKEAQIKPHKQLTIDLQDICYDENLFQQFANESCHDPSMPSFKIEPSLNHHNELKDNPIKRIQIQLQTMEPLQRQEKSEVNLDDLSNYYSDDQDSHRIEKQSPNQNNRLPLNLIQYNKIKQKPKIVLKSCNKNYDNREKQIIQDLKHDISQLKNKIQASFISQRQDQSFIKPKSHHKTVRIEIDLYENSNENIKSGKRDQAIYEDNISIAQELNELKHYVNNLQRKMLKDAGIHNEH